MNSTYRYGMMVKNRTVHAIFALVLLVACGGPAEPRLAVVIVVDQMRADHLTRFDEQFTGGFRRLIDEGAIFTDAHQDHAATETAVGHATIATGVFPRRHGIVGNTFFNRPAWRNMYSAEDSTTQLIGRATGAEDDEPYPGRSPRNMLAPALGDWLKEQSPDSRVYAVALKDRAAAFLGGHQSDGSYWYDEAGHFITSSYYASALPDWVRRFNDSDPFGRYRDTIWTRSADDTVYTRSRPDQYPGELIRGSDMPHRYPDNGRFYADIQISPFADEVTIAFAQTLVEAESIGDDTSPDLLFLGLSTPDHVGHRFGPHSVEIQDLYLRMDRMLGAFFDFLDDRVGADGYVVALTSDHGVLPLPEYLQERGVDARRVSARDADAEIGQAIEMTRLDHPYPIRLQFGAGLVLGYDSSDVTEEQADAFREALASRLRDASFLADTYTPANLASGSFEAPFVEMYQRQYVPDRTADIVFRYRENTVFAMSRGTTHGSPYPYDTHVPLVFMGPGVTPGLINRRVRTTDLAPTLTVLLGGQPPAGLDGEVLGGARN